MKKSKEIKLNVLGTIYSVEIKKQEEMRKVAESTNDDFFYGLCDFETKTLYLDSSILKNENCYKATFRHEIIHAFMYESGLYTQSTFAIDETCVDWFALQSPKIYKEFSILDIL